MAKRGRPAKRRKPKESLEEIKARIDAEEEAAKKRKEERGLTGAAADPSKQFKAKKISAIVPALKGEKKREDSIANESIDPVVIRLIGLNPDETFDIDYDTYRTLLREKMAAGRLSGSTMPTEEIQKVTDEFKRVKGKTGRFKAKSKKIGVSSFAGKLPPAPVARPTGASIRGGAIVKSSGGAIAKTTEKLSKDPVENISQKLNEVNKNVKGAVDSFSKSQKDEKKSKDAERVAADKAAKNLKEDKTEAKSARRQIPRALKKAISPFTDMFEKIGNFIKTIAFGTAVMEILRFLDDPAKFFQPLVDWSNNLIGKINDWSSKFIADSLKPVNNTIEQFNVKLKEIEDSLNGLLDKIPGRLGMGQISLGQIPSVPTQTIIEKTRIPTLGNPGAALQRAMESAKPGAIDRTKGGIRAPGAVSSSGAAEQVKKMGFSQEDFALYRDVVANIESKGKYDIQGGAGGMYAGRYQMGAAARTDAARYLGETYAGDTEAARKAFRESPEMQERYFAAYTRANHTYLMKNPRYAGMSKKEQLQVLGYAHNQGMGAAEKWLNRGMTASGADAFGTKGSRYSDEIKAAQQSGTTPSLVQPAVTTTNITSNQPEVAKSNAQLGASSVRSAAPPAPVARKPRVVVAPPSAAGVSSPGSSSSANQKDVPTFSATDVNNQSMLVIKSIYNIVG